ncbi:MAG: diguanylate cyclase [Candidatus Tectomicrobia bacterium]|uniref:diguanylate cyclase n=1 Tax=Tectimicrobiota bacterium TaxID=2528274 RepID=A0A933GM51_UNCTE|nr:diguanylate cyclase [Candidatus Tectomicrobia bacterium]
MDKQLYHLLFLDDDKDFLYSLNMAVSKLLLSEGNGVEIEPHFVSNPEEGLDFANELVEEHEKIAVIISDQQMPVMSGIEFMERVNKITPNAIKVLLTGYASLDSAKYAINHKILDQYVSKPIEDYDSFASLIKNAIKTFHYRGEKERAEQEIKNYVRQLEQINEKIKNMHSAAEKIAYLAQGFRKLDFDEVLDLIITKIPSIFNAKCSSLFLLDEKKNSLQMVRSNYFKEVYDIPLGVREKSPMMAAFKQNKTIVIPEIGEAPYDFLNKECLGRSCIVIPFNMIADDSPTEIMGSEEGIKGVLNMGNIPNIGNEEIIQYTASLIQDIVGINILNARLYQKTQRLALHDSLTGLYNKHIFMEFLKKECFHSERYRNPLFLAFGDIDDFKAINDTHGHRIGDEVLAQIGQLYKSVTRKCDMIARFGGDEFAWLIEGGDVENIVARLEGFCARVSSSEFPKFITLTMSIGLARYFSCTQDSPENLIDRADEALYRAKAKGKKRVEVSFKNGDK